MQTYRQRLATTHEAELVAAKAIEIPSGGLEVPPLVETERHVMLDVVRPKIPAHQEDVDQRRGADHEVGLKSLT